jgi:hypothetical protein
MRVLSFVSYLRSHSLLLLLGRPFVACCIWKQSLCVVRTTGNILYAVWAERGFRSVNSADTHRLLDFIKRWYSYVNMNCTCIIIMTTKIFGWIVKKNPISVSSVCVCF